MSAKELDAVLDAVGVDSAFPMISVDEALQLVLEHTPHSLGTETVALDQALGAVAATDVVCLMDLPPYEASIVDGFAIAEKDGQDLEGHDLRLTAATIAGSGRSVVLERGAKEAVYVTTGAPVPRNTSRVVPIERCTKGEAPGVVRVASLKAEHGNCWIRAAGSDVPAGKVIVSRDSTIDAGTIGLLGAAGFNKVTVRRRPTIAVLSTGDELRVDLQEGSEMLSAGQIHDANRPMLLAAIGPMGAGARVVDLGHVGDSRQALKQALRDALHRDDVDAVVTTGGVSMGTRDLIKGILAEMGKIIFGRLRMKPGKPTTFATVEVMHGDVAPARRRKVVFALPGNPVSALTTCNLLVAPAVRRFSGVAEAQCHSPRVVVELAHDFPLDPLRNTYHRVRLAWDAAKNRYQAVSTGPQRSSILLSIAGADALVCLTRAGARSSFAQAGSLAYAILLDGIGRHDALCPAPAVLLHDSVPRSHRFSENAATLLKGPGQQQPVHPDADHHLPVPTRVDDVAERARIYAGVFRAFIAHLRWRVDVQNIDMMNAMGFCRNCLAKWYAIGMRRAGHVTTYDEAREVVYGEPYTAWKYKNQRPATEEQQAIYKATLAKHARHEENPNEATGGLAEVKFQNIDDQALLAAGDTQLSADRAVQQAMAYGLDQLLVHLQWRADVPNLEMMNLMGACRNCLAKWMCLEAWKARPGSKFKHLTYENAKLLVNGNTNIAKPKATAAQLEIFNSGKGQAKHPGFNEGNELAKNAAAKAVSPLARAPAIGGAKGHSSVCCQDVEAVANQPHPSNINAPPAIHFGVLTVSDRAFRGDYVDLSGPAVESSLHAQAAAVGATYAVWDSGDGRGKVFLSDTVPDERAAIAQALRRFCGALEGVGGGVRYGGPT
eukprot:INCI15781.1.p1 GENE.INCI15781.1~~INCI15781.1.p1  ORF type:complete len:889 (-),score=161.10 INCI15781.1:420-3086(-)